MRTKSVFFRYSLTHFIPFPWISQLFCEMLTRRRFDSEAVRIFHHIYSVPYIPSHMTWF